MSTMMPNGREAWHPLAEAVAGASRASLVCDFDGTLAPRVDDPNLATPVAGTLEALEALAAAGLAVAILSGRGRDDLLLRIGPRDRVRALGSFGAEGDQSPLELTREQITLRQAARTLVVRVLEDFRPAWMESKPLGAAAHLRSLRPDRRAEAHAALAGCVAQCDGLFIRHEAHTAEVMIARASKRAATTNLRAGMDVCVYAGDDHSDAEAAEALREQDWFVIVGDVIQSVPGPARVLRCADPREFAALLQHVRARFEITKS